jgi:hypothetical protein
MVTATSMATMGAIGASQKSAAMRLPINQVIMNTARPIPTAVAQAATRSERLV